MQTCQPDIFEHKADLAAVHSLLDGAGGDEAVHVHIPALSNAEGAVHGLLVVISNVIRLHEAQTEC